MAARNDLATEMFPKQESRQFSQPAAAIGPAMEQAITPQAPDAVLQPGVIKGGEMPDAVMKLMNKQQNPPVEWGKYVFWIGGGVALYFVLKALKNRMLPQEPMEY